MSVCPPLLSPIKISREALANMGHDTRALQAYLGHKNIQHTVRHTELAAGRFKDFWRQARARLRWACYAQLIGSVQCRFVFVFGISCRHTMLFVLALPIHLFKNTLAGQFGFAATFA